MFNPDEAKYANGVVHQQPYPTDDIRALVQAAIATLDKVFRPGFSYSKAEVMLLGLYKRNEVTQDLFTAGQTSASERTVDVLARINSRWGKSCLRPARVPGDPEWVMRREMMSPGYTTNLGQLLAVG
ncbi:DUF4113 domain-containing protein [Pseudomonas turukhanskensis]|uniref:DUF4113 domain-containing protein n=1 Tax=Pseudomonas turukhanskensis TaxID=1806536 RepID=A0A9W6KB64_9PSED|nr:DUF4113 domain-containing protein [Pseudomonas turukhanskensis]GLK91596.1 hypothetical protein GCM10017655_46600 [Pseudomonas turukhanskensis]